MVISVKCTDEPLKNSISIRQWQNSRPKSSVIFGFILSPNKNLLKEKNFEIKLNVIVIQDHESYTSSISNRQFLVIIEKSVGFVLINYIMTVYLGLGGT